MRRDPTRYCGQDKGDYEGYSGDIGPDFVVTGHAENQPDAGTIKISDYPGVYTLLWAPSITLPSQDIYVTQSYMDY